MANRYWVGGSGNWDNTTTHWSAASAVSFTGSRSGNTLTTVGSPALVIGMTVRDATNVSLGTITGGSGNTWTTSGTGTVASQTMKAATVGASVPTKDDAVFFDANSSGTTAYTVTMTGALSCLDFTVSSLTPTFATGTTPTLAVWGSMSLATGTVWSSTGAITFSATTTGKTITTNGVSIPANMTLNGLGGGWTLGSALTNTGGTGLTITNGSFSTGNFAMTLSGFSSSNSNVRSVSLGSSTVIITANSFNFSTTTNLTFNAGTSTINITTAAITFSYGTGLTFYNLILGAPVSSTATYALAGSGTFNSVTFPSGTSYTTPTSITFYGDNTIGTLVVGGQVNPYSRLFITSNTAGTTRTQTVGVISGTLGDADFADIAIAGAAAPLTGTRLGDLGGNSGITFPAGKNVYWVSASSQSWHLASWALTAGGAPTVDAFPLAQDTAIIGSSLPSSGSTITFATTLYLPALDLSARTASLITLQTNTAVGMNFCGDVTLASGVTLSAAGSAVYYYYMKRGTQNIILAGRSLSAINGQYVQAYGGSVVLNENWSVSNMTLNSGTLNLNGFNMTVTSAWGDSGSLTRGIDFAGGVINLTGSGTVFNMTTGSNFSYTGTPTINVSNATATPTTVNAPASGVTDSNALNFNFTTGTYTLTLGSGRYYGNLNFTGFSGSVANVGIYILGDLTMATTTTYMAGANAWTFTATTGTRTITTNGRVFNFPVVFGFLGGNPTWRLADALVLASNRSISLFNGTLDLNGYTLTAGSFIGSGTSVRSIAFGTGNITLTGTGTVWSLGTVTNFTISGTPTVNISNASAVATSISQGLLTSEANALNFNITTGTYNLGLGSVVGSLNFTGFSGSLSNSTLTIYGSVTISSTMSLAAGTSGWTFASTSGVETITTNGKALDFPLTFNGAGGTFQLQDALTMGSTRTLLHAYGTIDLNGKTFTVGSQYLVASGVKNITFNGGVLVCPASSTVAFNNLSPSGFTTTAGIGTGYISMTGATAKTFVGGGSTYNCTLRQSGVGALTITGSNTFDNIVNTVQPVTITFTAGTTTTFNNFGLSGTTGSLVTIQSTGGGSHTLYKSSGVVSCNYLSISNSNATGGATWNAFTSNGNVNAGNNTGWVFSEVALNNFFFFFN